MEIYRIKNLTFTYPESIHPALDNVNITINKGEWLLICGKSGCGKTTLLKHLVSVMAPQGKLSGDVIYNGKPLNAVDRLTQSLDIGYVMQNMYLTKDTISYCYWNEGYKEMGAPEEFYVANGYLLVTIEAVAGMRNQVVFKGIKMDPAVELTEHPAIGWYGREGFAIPQFKAFIDMLAAQAYMIEADNAAAPKMLTFKGVEDSGSVFKLRLMEK